MIAAITSSACATGKFRYDRLKEDRDNVDMRDLEELLKDGMRPPELKQGDVTVKQVEYNFKAEKDEYRLGKNDVLNIFVLNHPELSSQRVDLGQISGTTIRKNGKVHLPVVGALQAEGLTITEFEDSLREAVAKFEVHRGSPRQHRDPPPRVAEVLRPR